VGASQQEIISGLAEIIEEVTGIEPSEVTPEKSFVDDLDLAGLRTVGDVVAYIQKLEEENPEAAEALREKFAK
jgi:acyl carrier protein